MRELALFAGAGGGILGGKLLGWRTVCAVEINDHCQQVLMQRQDDGLLDPFPIWPDINTFNGRCWRGLVDVVSGGFPCQDISEAGSGAGIDGERSGLWSEMARIIREVRPQYAFVENVPALTYRGLERVLGDLAGMGFDARWGVFSAAGAGAPHLRRRLWIVAHANSRRGRADITGRDNANRKNSGRKKANGLPGAVCDPGPERSMADANCDTRRKQSQPVAGSESQTIARSDRSEESLAHADGESRNEGRTRDATEGIGGGHAHRSGLAPDVGDTNREGKLQPEGIIEEVGRWPADAGWWAAEPPVGRVVDGLADRVDELAAIGNGQVPAVVVRAWEELAP